MKKIVNEVSTKNLTKDATGVAKATFNGTVKKAVTLLLVLVMAAVGFTGCGEKDGAAVDGDNSNAQTSSGSTLIYGSGDYTAINPALYEHGEINELIFAGLTGHDKDNNVIPELAEEWSFDEETLTYTFKLKEGLAFHDGEPVSSKDVKFTIEAILNPDNGSEIATNYQDIVAVNCPNDLTVEIVLDKINVAIPEYMTIAVLPSHILEGQDLATCDFNQNPIGAGPYKFVDWDMGQSITLERFDNYFAGPANIETVIFKIVPDTDSRALQLKSGDIDMAQVTAKSAETFSGDENYAVYQMTTADYRAIAYNYWNEYWQKHPELPNILGYGIDKQAIVDSVLLGEGQVAYSPIQKNEYNDSSIEQFSYDPEKCQKLLEEAGWAKGANGYYAKDGEELAFVISAMADDQVRVDMATMCAAQLQEIGVNATAEAKPSLDWAGQYACIIGWGSPFDADDHMFKVFTTDAGDNYTGYSNPTVDEALETARSTFDSAERKAAYSKALKAMTEEQVPYNYIAYVDADYVMKANIKGITPETSLGHHGVGVFWNISQWTIE